MKKQANKLIVDFLEIDMDYLKESLENAKTLVDHKELFQSLAALSTTKEQINNALEQYSVIEKEIKQYINDKAKALYGTEWNSISAEHYKISRSFTGSVYDITDDVQSKFVIVKKSPNTKEIENYVKAKSKLPKGVEYSPNRGESIRITVK